MSIYASLRSGDYRIRPLKPKPIRRNRYMDDSVYDRYINYNSRRFYRIRPRNRPRVEEEDRRRGRDKLDKDEKEKMEELERRRRENEDKARLDEDRLKELENECLVVKDIDLQIERNTTDHHTDLYDCTEDDDDPQLVVRRGQEFDITLGFQRPWDNQLDDMYLVFRTGTNPSRSQGTNVTIKLEEGNDTDYKDGDDKDWGARIKEKKDNSLTISVFSPPDCIIGQWEYVIRTKSSSGSEEYDCEGSEDVIILLNPWCKDDLVYMEDDDERDEYVMNQSGRAFRGKHSRISSTPWIYGQFDKGILDTCLYLLRKSFNKVTQKQGNPINISRGLSRIINNLDDEGVLVGKWGGGYGNHIKPTHWKSSANILTKYAKNKYKPIKYGQCWVFSHLLTAVARALGLPCRSVTNFASAHDTEANTTIDKFVDEDGDEVETKSKDSVWNFHVWNEVWFHRPELGDNDKYGGWQAIDATPQESSEGVFQCGPSPLKAIREGRMDVGYDTKFIFAEVNADRLTWLDKEKPVLVKKLTNSVGRNISTKGPKSNSRVDITHLYKNLEGTVAEREAVNRALSYGDRNRLKYLTENKSGITMEILETHGKIGQDFSVRVKVKNESDEEREIQLTASVRPMNYWGTPLGKLFIAKKKFGKDTIKPNETELYELKVDGDEAYRKCEDLSFQIGAMLDISGFETKLVEAENDELEMDSSVITIKGPSDKVSIGESFEVEVEVNNPLDKSLRNCRLNVEGSVIVDDSRNKFTKEDSVWTTEIGNIGGNRDKKVTFKVMPTKKPTRSKERELIVSFECDGLPEVEESWQFKVY